MIQLLAMTTLDRSHGGPSVANRLVATGVRLAAAFAVAVPALPIAAAPAVAATACPTGSITWTAPGDGNWDNAANWSSPSAPGGTDDVCIETDVTVTVDNPLFAAANQLVSAGTLGIETTLILNDTSETNRIALDGSATTIGSIEGPGSLTITGTGSTWNSGFIRNSVEIASGADLEIGGFANLSGSLTNRGTVTQSTRNYTMSGTVTNHGTWYLTYPFADTVIVGSGTFKNQATGTVERPAGATAVAIETSGSVTFEHRGAIVVRNGSLQIRGISTIDGATMHVDGAATLEMSADGTASVEGTSTMSGTGTVEWTANRFDIQDGAVVNVAASFRLAGAEISGPGTFSISGDAVWTKGLISGNVEIPGDGALEIDRLTTSTELHVTGTLINRGTVTQPDAGLYATLPGAITNDDDGLWQFTNTEFRDMVLGDGPFLNDGTLEGNSPNNNVAGLPAGLDFRNNGKVVARAGQLWIASAPSHYAGTVLSGGTWEARDGARLAFPAAITESTAELTLTGPGSSFGYLASPFNIQPINAFDTNGGTLRLAEGADFATGSDFTSNGTLIVGNAANPGDPSTLTVNGDLTLGAAGTFDVQVGVDPVGRIEVTGSATLGGALEAHALAGFEPGIGVEYQVMSYASMSGSFASIDVAPFYGAAVRADEVVLVGIDPVPIADAGGPYSVPEGAAGLTLDGSASDDPGTGSIISYLWQPAGSFTDNTVVGPTFTNTIDNGTFPVTLTACDDALPTSQCNTDGADVVVTNVAPTVSAIADQTIDEGETFGPAVAATFTDPGSADTHTATIDWGHGPVDAIGSAALPISGSHTYPDAGDFVVTITVTDKDGGSHSDTFTITVNDTSTPPVSNPGGPYSGDEGEAIPVDGSASSDPDGTVESYLWTATDGSFDDPTSATTTFTAPDDGTYTLTLEVIDNDGIPDTETTMVTVHNVAPSIDAGPDVEADTGEVVEIDATFTDPGADTWTATISWGDGTIDDPATVEATTKTVSGRHTYLSADTWTVTVCVSDGDGGQDCDGVTATVSSASGTPPIADAGGPYRGREGSWIRLNGRRSHDPDGNIVSYHWTATGGVFNNPDKARPKFRAPDDGTYTLTLTVTDDDGLTDSMTTTVTVKNARPKVDAGNDTRSRAGGAFRLEATFTDRGSEDTHVAVINWGDGHTTTVDSATSPINLNHRYPQVGTYRVKVTVTDDDGGSRRDTVKVKVSRRAGKCHRSSDHRIWADRAYWRCIIDQLRHHWRGFGHGTMAV